jgi:hypothetical protein
MSADNGVYILKLKDQYRVIHAQAIENLNYSFISGFNSGYVPTRIVEYYSGTRYTRDIEKAMQVANAIARGCYILEYGIIIITVNKTWKQILREAKTLAPLEIAAIKENCGDANRWKYELKQLEDVIKYCEAIK